MLNRTGRAIPGFTLLDLESRANIFTIYITRNQGFMAHLINLICLSTYVHLRPILCTFEADSLYI